MPLADPDVTGGDVGNGNQWSEYAVGGSHDRHAEHTRAACCGAFAS